MRWDPPTDELMPVQWKSKEFQFPYQENFGAYAIYWDDARYSNVDWGTLDHAGRPSRCASRSTPTAGSSTTRRCRRTAAAMRLPSGFKSDIWQFEIRARAPVYSLHVASTMKELRDV